MTKSIMICASFPVSLTIKVEVKVIFHFFEKTKNLLSTFLCLYETLPPDFVLTAHISRMKPPGPYKYLAFVLLFMGSI